MVTEAHACEQLAHGRFMEVDRPRFKPATQTRDLLGHERMLYHYTTQVRGNEPVTGKNAKTKNKS